MRSRWVAAAQRLRAAARRLPAAARSVAAAGTWRAATRSGWARSAAVVVVLLAALSTAVYVERGATAHAGASPRAAAAPGTPVPPLLAFTAGTLDGATFDGAGLAGRPTVLWFWAPWCGTCAGMAQSVSDVAEEYGNRLAVVGVAGLGDVPAMHSFVSDTQVGGIPQINDEGGVVWRRFGVAEQSTYVLLDRAGKVTYRGWLDDLEFNARVKALVG